MAKQARNRIRDVFLGFTVVPVCVALAVLWCLQHLPCDAQAQDANVSVRLAKIRADVSSGERTLAELKAEFKKLKTDEKALTTEIDKLTFEEQALVERSVQVAREKESLVAKVRSAEEQVELEQAKIRSRLRSLYLHNSDSAQGLLLSAMHSRNVERAAVYSRAVRLSDERRFAQVKAVVEQLVEARQKLDLSLEESQRLQSGVHAKRVELDGRRGKLQGILRQIQEKQQKAKASLASLMSEASKLEDLLRQMTGGETSEQAGNVLDDMRPVEPTAVQPIAPTIAEQVPEKGTASDRRIRDVMHPEGLFGRSVRVVTPVRGEVVQRFGKTKVANFSDMIFSKGFEYKTAEGSQVRAVLGGRVVFAGEMPGYDTVVIVDHGARSYSLYGRLGKSLVQKGALVGQKDPVGVTSAPDDRGRNFYFETRKNGSPVDPGGVLARAS